jgi:hypothetical protein
LVVLTVSVGFPPVSVLVWLYSAVPEQSLVAYRLNATVPSAARLPAVADTVAVSFGIQLCFVLISVRIGGTTTASSGSAHAVASDASVFGRSPP